MLLVDEAYIHFGENPDLKSALPYVRQGKDVIVTRTFSKIYGMAGLRVGFAAAKPEIIDKLAPLRMNVIPIVSARGRGGRARPIRTKIVRERRATLGKTRRELCAWLQRAQREVHRAARQLHDDRHRPQRARVHHRDAEARRRARAARSRRSTTCCA